MRLADAAKFPDFTAKDLSAPDPARTRNVLSALINFIKFTEQCQPFISSLRNESARLVEERATVVRQLGMTKRELAAARSVDSFRSYCGCILLTLFMVLGEG